MMNRRHFIGTLATTAATSTLVEAQDSPAPVTTSAPLTRTPLVLMAPRSDGIEAIWAVNQLSKGRLELEVSDGSVQTIGADRFGFVPQSKNVVRIRIDNLKPGQSYRVRAITTAAASGQQFISDWKSFRTLNPSSPTANFVVWNDTHVNNETIQKLHEVTPAADFLVWNGDTCNDWKSPDLLIPTLLHPGNCDITTGRPLLLTMGNHDARGPHAFELPDTIATPNNRPFYAFRAGPIAAICLHTGEDKPDDHPSFQGRVAFDQLRREQSAWLADTIRQSEFRDAPYRIIICHIPLRWLNETPPDYTKAGFDHFSLRSRDAWHQSLVDWKAQLIISGHTHRNALIPATDQFPYIQITGGGPQPNSATWMKAVATAEEFNLQVSDLDGTIRHEIKLKPLV
jgi:hypothetical protein